MNERALSWEHCPEQLQALRNAAKTGHKWDEVAAAVNNQPGPKRTPNACRMKWRSLVSEEGEARLPPSAEPPPADAPDPNALEIDRLRRLVKYFKSEERKLRTQVADASNLVEHMKDALAPVEPLPIWIPPQVDTEQEEEEAVILFSDAQLGTKMLGEELGLTDPRVWGPLGAYNIDIFRYRLRVWLRSVKKIVDLQRSAIPIFKANLWFLGDVLENEWIWKGQGAYIETGLLQQFFVALYEVAQAIAVLASWFKEVEIHAVYGNHGRGTPRKNQSKTWVNWEFLWYRYLELLCRDIPNVKFVLALTWFDVVEVQGHSTLLIHGEDIRRYMRFPWYSAERMEKAYNELLGAVGRPFTYMMFGHHHVAAQFQNSHGEWICNGNWVGPTMYSMKTLWEMVKPSQWLFFMHPKRGIASRWLLDLTIENQEIWDDVQATAYDVHIPMSNAELLYAVQMAQRKIQI